MDKKKILRGLIQMSRNIGNPGYDYVILAEGNTSAKIDDRSFFVKASGYYMENIDEKGFVQVYTEPVMGLLERGSMTDEQIKESFINATVNYNGILPSIESILHAICIAQADASFVCHTHPESVNAILCSKKAEVAFSGMLFPDEVTLCGPAVLYVEWAQPGLDLAKKVSSKIEGYKQRFSMPPRIIVMQNHGLISLGKNGTQVENMTHMFVKASRIRLGTFSLGGPQYMTEKDVDRIFQRPDEKYRESLIFKSKE